MPQVLKSSIIRVKEAIEQTLERVGVNGNAFFQEQREQSLIKARIVAKYFSAWSNVILASQKRYPQYTQRMAYVDLFAGPGRYDDQSKSTPVLVLETILANQSSQTALLHSLTIRMGRTLKA